MYNIRAFLAMRLLLDVLSDIKMAIFYMCSEMMVCYPLLLRWQLHIVAVGEGKVGVVAGDNLEVVAFEWAWLICGKGGGWYALLCHQSLACLKQIL